MNKLKAIIVAMLCIVVGGGTLLGCDKSAGYDLKPTELTHYDYADGDGMQFNTELFYRNSLEIALGDPAVLYVEEGKEGGGYFYITGTTSVNAGFNMWRTKDFTTYEDLGNCYVHPDDFFGRDSFWAPQLMYDATADWQYYLGEAAGEGEGLYILTFSATYGDSSLNLGKRLTVAFSKTPDGPYQHFVGTNQNGKYMDASTPLFDNEELKDVDFSEWENANPLYGPIYKQNRAQIDAAPFIAPDGTKYLYFVKTRSPSSDRSNDCWGVKMLDWVTPVYETTRPLTSHSYTTTNRDDTYEYSPMGKIDEGPFMYYDEETAKYYLTFSLGDTDDKFYPVAQAVGDSPLGPFTKVQPSEDGLLNKLENDWDIHGSGHHCFFMVGDEMWIGYHSYEILGAYGIGSRYFSCDKVNWTTNANGLKVMHVNGPAKNMQPLPEAVSGYKNVALNATVKATNAASGSTAAQLNDGLLSNNEDDIVQEYVVKGNETTITLTFTDYVTARAIMVYNSRDFFSAFDEVEKIEFSYRKEINGKKKTGIAYINKLGFNLDTYQVPLIYLGVEPDQEAAGDYDESLNVLRPCSAAIAEFDELEVNKITIKIKKGANKTGLAIPDIVVLGKTA